MKTICQFDPEDVLRRYADMVYRVCRVNSSTKENAEDAFQEVFVKLISCRKAFESEEHLKAWLIRVAVNQCRTIYSASHWQKETSFEEQQEKLSEAGEEPFCEMDDFDAADRSSVMEQALQCIPPDDRLLIHLFYYEDYPVKKIAEILGISPTLIGVRLHRSRKKLKTYFEERGLRYEDL